MHLELSLGSLLFVADKDDPKEIHQFCEKMLRFWLVPDGNNIFVYTEDDVQVSQFNPFTKTYKVFHPDDPIKDESFYIVDGKLTLAAQLMEAYLMSNDLVNASARLFHSINTNGPADEKGHNESNSAKVCHPSQPG